MKVQFFGNTATTIIPLDIGLSNNSLGIQNRVGFDELAINVPYTTGTVGDTIQTGTIFVTYIDNPRPKEPVEGALVGYADIIGATNIYKFNVIYYNNNYRLEAADTATLTALPLTLTASTTYQIVGKVVV